MPITQVPRAVDWSALLQDAVTRPGLISQAYGLFWRYSFSNQLWALIQCMQRKLQPGPIHTYRGWQSLGRQVRKGEKAITLVMPVEVKRRPSDRWWQAAAAEPAPDDGADPARKVRIFVERPYWFVLSQTDGQPVELQTVPEWDQAIALTALSVEQVPFDMLDGNCQGYARGRQIAVSPIAFMPHRTFFHELAHVELGHTAELQGLIDHGERTPRDLREVEAECVALICSSALGLPGEDFSRGYIQHWLNHQTVPDRSVQRIFKAADAILRAGRPPDAPAETDVPAK